MNATSWIGAALVLASAPLSLHAADENHYALRTYHEFTGSTLTVPAGKGSIEVRTFTFKEPERAAIFASKIYSDYLLTVANKLMTLDTPKGPVDAIALDGGGFIVPLMESKGDVVHVLIGDDQTALAAQAGELLKTAPARSAQLTHSPFMDKWDRYCIGVWGQTADILADPDNKTPESYYNWLGKVGLNEQIVNASISTDLSANDNQLRWLRKYFKAGGVHYQNVEWLQAYPDLYNRNPFLSSFDGPGMMTQWSYYGEVPHAPGLLRDVQHAPILTELTDYTQDDNLMAILDADGEIGPFKSFFWGEYGPVQQRNFVRYLKEIRHFSLDDVSKRYYGKPGALKSWDDVTLADWRTFYGWDDTSVDLAGEWRVMREGDSPGVREGWQSPAFNDKDWIALSYPGDTTLYTIFDPAQPRAVWMRRTITVDPKQFPGPIYLSIAPLTEGEVQVFVDGKRLGILTPRYHTARVFGQFDVTDLVKANPNLSVALRIGGHDIPSGPVFLTSHAIQDFPTDDPLLNARRYDHFDFMDWAIADSVGSMLRQVRTIDPDRPIKVHAYESPWGWKMIQELGGYSHHTGTSAGWYYTNPKQYGLTRNLQDSSETGGSMDTPRNIKGLFGCLAYMGKNAHDYFHDLQSITMHPGMRDWLVSKLPDIRVMGRVNVHASPIACLRGLRSDDYIGEFYKVETWRNAYNLTKGGEMTPLLDEIRVGEGRLPYPAIVDESTVVWDEKMTAALEDYVKQGGVLFLQSGSGLHTPTQRDAYPGPTLAGVHIEGSATAPIRVKLTAEDPIFENLSGDVGQSYKHQMSDDHVITALPGTDVLGTTPDDQPVITRRALGKGFVYYCAGGQWPKAMQDKIAEYFGCPVFVKVEGGVDLARTSRSNDGCEEMLMLRGLGGKPATVKWTFDFAPTAIYNPVTGAPVEATIEGNTATFTVNIDDWDFAWYAARRPNPPEQFAHWLQRQTEIWGGYTKGDPIPKPELFRTFDLNREWKLAQTDSQDAAEKLMALDDKAAKLMPTDLGWWSAPGTGLKSGKGVFGLYRRDFILPAGWEKNARIDLKIGGQIWGWPQIGFGGPSTIYLNGTQIWTGDQIRSASLDLTASIKPGANRLEIVHEGEGILASMNLVRTINADTTVDLAGEWQAVDGLQSVRTVTLPDKVNTSFVYRDIDIPKEQAGKEVWLRVDTEDVNSSRSVIVNGRERYPVTRPDNSQPMEVNITPEIRFGEKNRILIDTGAMDAGWKRADHNFRKIELCYYAPGRWSQDGKGIRDALTPKELESVKQMTSRVQLYPLAQNAISKSAANLFPFSEAEAKAYVPSTPMVDLDFSATDGTVTDKGSEHIPVTVLGHVAPFSERGGAVTGLQIFAEDKDNGGLSLPGEAMSKLLAGRNYTICAWIKPLLAEKTSGPLVRWPEVIAWEVTDNGTFFQMNNQWPTKADAREILTQRQWHFLAVTVNGTVSTLYVDGINVADQTWSKGQVDSSNPFYIGNYLQQQSLLNMKLARFIIYSDAMTEDEIGKLYLQDKSRFESAGQVWPEDYICRFKFATDGATDASEFPAKLKPGAGTTPKVVDGKPVLDFDGKNSSLLVKEDPRTHLLGAPFSMIIDFNPVVDGEGCIFRRIHDMCLDYRKDGAVIFDANIGKHNMITFPGAVVPGQWNRLMLTYDGKVVAVYRDGTLIGKQDYLGALSTNRNWDLSVGADNTYGSIPFVHYLPMQMREFAIYPRVLDAMPPAP